MTEAIMKENLAKTESVITEIVDWLSLAATSLPDTEANAPYRRLARSMADRIQTWLKDTAEADDEARLSNMLFAIDRTFEWFLAFEVAGSRQAAGNAPFIEQSASWRERINQLIVDTGFDYRPQLLENPPPGVPILLWEDVTASTPTWRVSAPHLADNEDVASFGSRNSALRWVARWKRWTGIANEVREVAMDQIADLAEEFVQV